jgi:hypothetical protein
VCVPGAVAAARSAADADLVAAGLLLEVKTIIKKPSLAVLGFFQVISYALLNFEDEYQLDAVALFSTGYAYFAEWNSAHCSASSAAARSASRCSAPSFAACCSHTSSRGQSAETVRF